LDLRKEQLRVSEQTHNRTHAVKIMHGVFLAERIGYEEEAISGMHSENELQKRGEDEVDYMANLVAFP